MLQVRLRLIEQYKDKEFRTRLTKVSLEKMLININAFVLVE